MYIHVFHDEIAQIVCRKIKEFEKNSVCVEKPLFCSSHFNIFHHENLHTYTLGCMCIKKRF